MLKYMICAASLVVAGAAYAEETTIIKRESSPSVEVVAPVPVPIERRSTSVTTSSGCDTTVVHKENDMGDSKTVRKTEC